MSPFSRFSRRSPLRFVISGVAVALLTATAPTQAQTPASNGAKYAEYSENTDASFADRVARRSAVAPTPSNARPVDAPKSQAAQTLEAFLFGTPNRPVSKPKFAFAQRDADVSAVRASHSPQTAQTPQSLPTAQKSRPTQNNAPTPDAEIADARRRRLQELNALLATRRPEEFSRRLALKNAAVADASQELDAPEVADASAARFNAVLRTRAELPNESADAPFDAARANRSKIRQASNFEPARPLELADDGFATFLLPTRPNALRLSPNVFLSTDLVRLPSAAPLREAPESAPTTQAPQNLQAARPLQNAQPPANVATPLPAASESTDVPTLRPTAQFVEPRFLPTRR